MSVSVNWGYGEVSELLRLRGDDETRRCITGTVKDGPIFERIAKRLQERGYNRGKAQVTSKLKTLRRKFLQVLDNNSQSHNEPIHWPYYDQCYCIWGPGQSDNLLPPLGFKEEEEAAPGEPAGPSPPPSPSLCPVDAAEEEEDSSQDTEPGAPEPGAPEGFYDDTEEQPPRPKKRKVTRAQVVTREIQDLLISMDRQDDHRERLRAERQWAHEEQLRTETREAERRQRAEQMSAFEGMFRNIQREMQSQTALLRDLVSRMPVQQSTRHYNGFPSQPEY